MKNIVILSVLITFILSSCRFKSLTSGDFTVKFGDGGEVLSMKKSNVGYTTGGAAYAARLTYGEELYDLDKTALKDKSAIPDGYRFSYVVATDPLLRVDIEYTLKEINGATVLGRVVNIQKPATNISLDLRVEVPILPALLVANTWLPLRNGTVGTVGNDDAWTGVYNCTTKSSGTSDLAVPLVTFPNSDLGGKRVTVMTDPYFSSIFTKNSVHWTYPSLVGLTDEVEKREIYLSFHNGDHNDAFRTFYDNPLADVPAGQKWLKDVAMVNYDYMSTGKTGIRGAGWYENIDAISEDITDMDDRRKILFNIHGWYDRVGKYAYDPVTKTLNREPWKHFINGISTESQPFLWDGFEMSLEEMHKRINYAKERGYKIALYFADGMLNCPLNGPDYYDPSNPERIISKDGWAWTYVDTYWEKPFRNNPSHPWAQEFYLGYAEALMREFGNEIDAIVWDETYYIEVGFFGPEKYPAYSNRDFMRLIKKIKDKVHSINPNVAFLSSDCSGYFYPPPYALVTDGTYQDLWGEPKYFPYGYFPNYRNQLWCCMWFALGHEAWMKESVEEHQAPVVWTDGFGTNGGWAKLTSEQKKFLLDLFEARKQYPTDYSKLILSK